MRLFPGLELTRKQFRKLFRRDPATIFHVNKMRREAAQLIPCNNIVRRSGDELLQTGSRKRVMCDIPEADFVAVAKKTDTCGESCLDRAKRFVTARRGDAVSFAEQFAFQQISAASPLGNFQAGAELRF